MAQEQEYNLCLHCEGVTENGVCPHCDFVHLKPEEYEALLKDKARLDHLNSLNRLNGLHWYIMQYPNSKNFKDIREAMDESIKRVTYLRANGVRA